MPEDQSNQKLSEILQRLVSENYELRAQNYAFRQALVTLASSLLRRPSNDLFDSLEDEERFWHQWILERLEDHSPSAAALVDRRKANEVWTPPEE
jgi:uncharacterized membrane protein affecting hemolysin expression